VKRSGMPRRSTPLRAKTGLRRSTALRARSSKRADPARLEEEARVRSAVFQRDRGCLLRYQHVEWGECMGRRTLHHLRKASAGGTYTEDNGVCLCVRHNDDVEDDPPRARAWGLVVTAGITAEEAAARRAAWAPTERETP
jgi:hypothetical protein